MFGTTHTHAVLLSFSLLLSGGIVAAGTPSPFEYTFSTPSEQIDLAVGEQADVLFTLGNPTSTASPMLRIGISDWRNFEVQLLPGQGCGDFYVYTGTGSSFGEVFVPSIPAMSSRVCTFRIRREAGSMENLSALFSLGHLPPSNVQGLGLRVVVGTFADVALDAVAEHRTTDGNGITHATYRVSARNDSGLDLGRPFVILGRTCIAEPIQIDMAFTGGCEFAEAPCAFGGQPGSAAILPALTANQVSSCLVRLAAPAASTASMTALMVERYTDPLTGMRYDDSDISDNRRELTVNLDDLFRHGFEPLP